MRPLHWAPLDKRRPVLVLTREIVSIPVGQLHEQCGWLLETQELALHEAIQAAFDLV